MYLHYDMDAFFPSVEQRDNPQLKNMPLAIGYGVVTSCSYEARKYGVKSAMPMIQARKLCKNLIVVPARVEYYFEVGRSIQEYISTFFNDTLFTSCDEGFIKIDEVMNKRYEKKGLVTKEQKEKDLLIFARQFKRRVENMFNLKLSIGIGSNRAMAKMATEINKPNGIYIFKTKEQFISYVFDKNLDIFPGIGEKTYSLLKTYGIVKTSDLLKKEKEFLISILGDVRGAEIYDLIRGNSSYMYDNISKDKSSSIGKEKTFLISTSDEKEIMYVLGNFSNYLENEIYEKEIYPKTITLKLRYTDFRTITRSKSFENPFYKASDILKKAKEIYYENILDGEELRLIGLTISNFSSMKFEYIKMF